MRVPLTEVSIEGSTTKPSRGSDTRLDMAGVIVAGVRDGRIDRGRLYIEPWRGQTKASTKLWRR